MAERYRTPGGWTLEVLQLAEGDRRRIRRLGWYVADVVKVDDLIALDTGRRAGVARFRPPVRCGRRWRWLAAAGRGQPAIASSVAVVIVLSRLVLREHLGRREYACVAVMGLAVILLALSPGSAAGEVGHRFGSLQAAAVAIPSVLTALAAGGSALRAGARRHGPPVTGVSYSIATGMLYGVAALAIKALSGALLHQHGIANVTISPATVT